MGGIIYNARGLEDEDGRLERFSQAVGLPILVKIPRSDLFGTSEREKQCVVERYPDSDLASIFHKLSKNLLGDQKLYAAKPVDSSLLEAKVLLTGKNPEGILKKAFKEEVADKKVVEK